MDRRHWAAGVALAVGGVVVGSTVTGLTAGSQTPYADEMSAAMDRMMADMMVPPSGDVDRDFVVMMVPHHEGAIAMAQTYLRYGRNEQLTRIAEAIVVDQEREIAAMYEAIGEAAEPVESPAGSQVAPAHSHTAQ